MGKITLVNATALAVNFYEGDEQFEVPMSGLQMIKLGEETTTPEVFKDGIKGMPVVTALVIKEAKRKDFIAPDTGVTSMRDTTGELTGRKNAVIRVRQWITTQ